MIQDMSARRTKDYEFDWNRMLSFEGDTGPYLQYAHSRLCSIERQAPAELMVTAQKINELDLSTLVEPQAKTLWEIVLEYPDVVKHVSTTMEPCNLSEYCFKLCHAVSSAYDVLWVHGRERQVAQPRLALYKAARITLNNAMRLLGLEPLSRM
jgi:arginyl-tRNA synthetase